MLEFAQIRWKAETLHQLQLPDIAYPVPIDQFSKVFEGGADIAFEYQMYWLQEYSASLDDGWAKLEPAMQRLAKLIALDDQRPAATVQGDDWFIEIRPLNLEDTTVTIQRRDCVLAALQPRSDGTLCCAIFHMLDAKSLRYLLKLSVMPNDSGEVCMRPNNWEYALDQAVPSIASYYTDERGESYLSLWEQGLGVVNDGSTAKEFTAQKYKPPLAANLAATQIGVFYELSSE